MNVIDSHRKSKHRFCIGGQVLLLVVILHLISNTRNCPVAVVKEKIIVAYRPTISKAVERLIPAQGQKFAPYRSICPSLEITDV